MFNNKGKPIDMLVVENTKIDGEEVNAGTVLKQCEHELAMDLASGGKARAATEAALAEFKKNQANAKAAAAAQAEVVDKKKAEANEAMAAMVASAVAAALKAAGVVPAAPAKT